MNGLFPQQPLQFGQPPYPPPQPVAKPPKDYLIWSIITAVCCFPVLGIIAIIFSVQAKSAFQVGDYAGYESKTKVAFWCNLIGLIVGILGLIVMIGVQLALLLPAVSSARGAAMRMQCTNHEKQIMLAIHNYHDVYNGLPPLYTVDDDGKPLHSWRVLILPFMEYAGLIEQIHLDEPWDSEYNKRFHDQVVNVYRCPSRPLVPGTCAYSAIAGVGLIPAKKAGDKTSGNFGRIEDGTSNTLAIVEVEEPFCWMDPTADVTLDELLQGINKGRVGSKHPGGANAALFDGSVRFWSNSTDTGMLKALATPDDGDTVGMP